MASQSLPPDDAFQFPVYNAFNDVVFDLFPGLTTPEAGTELMPIVRHSNFQEEHISSKTGYEDLLSKAEEALRRHITNKSNSIYTEQGPDSSKTFLSALFTLPTESFDQLWAIALRTSTTFDPNTLLPATQDLPRQTRAIIGKV
jgi:hypothetical protein